VGNDVTVKVIFPFGRYAATPWFRSRREHVDNVEWPPSPWRLARSLVAVSDQFGTVNEQQELEALVRELATVEPHYRLPRSVQVIYTQWMPQLEFDDSPLAGQRADNGHTLLDVDPEDPLVVSWPGVELTAPHRDLLRRLLERLRFLGQSVSVCEATLLEDGGEPPAVALSARPLAVDQPAPARHRVVRLLVPLPSVGLADLQASTADGVLKAMPAPPGSAWREYEVEQWQLPTLQAREPKVQEAIYRLNGVLRPRTPRPEAPAAPAGRGHATTARFARALSSAWGFWPRADHHGFAVARAVPVDDDGDGRAERLIVTLTDAQAATQVRSLLAPPGPLKSWNPDTGERMDCALQLEAVTWGGDAPRPPAPPVPGAVCFALDSDRSPLLVDGLTVTEVFHRRLMGVARRRFGAASLPERLTGRDPNGMPLRDHHAHIHILFLGPLHGEVAHLIAWAPGGFTRPEREVIEATTLPALCGAPVRLLRVEGHPVLTSSRTWRSLTPFLPARHWKRRANGWRDLVEHQVVRELEERRFPCPAKVERVPGPWRSFRSIRRSRAGAHPELGQHGLRLEFDVEVRGPIALGRNSHFGMGVFVPIGS
jgi:hypothetical protein